MTEADTFADRLAHTYREQVRPRLEEHRVSTIGASNQAAMLLERLHARKRDLGVPVLGETQMDKSSLINALLGMRALPAGGSDRLTAQATRIVYTGDQLNRAALTLGRHLLRRSQLPVAHASSQSPRATEGGLRCEGTCLPCEIGFLPTRRWDSPSRSPPRTCERRRPANSD